MGVLNQTTVTLAGVGGCAPYAYTILNDAGTTIPASISGSALTVDASGREPGTYAVHLQITDSTLAVIKATVPVRVVGANSFTVLNENQAVEPDTFPANISMPLLASGGVGALTWALIPAVTTLPQALIAGPKLLFTINTFGTWTVGLRATDTLGNTATRLIEYRVSPASTVSMIDGQVEIALAPAADQVGTHSFTLKVLDANTSASAQTFTYGVGFQISEVELTDASVEHVWCAGDTTSITVPIAGDLSGYQFGDGATFTTDNGLSVAVDTINDAFVVTGPPTSFGNAEFDFSVSVQRNYQEVATITRQFTLVSHSGSGDLGTMTCFTRPYITGEFVGLNPLRPFFNAPGFPRNQAYTVRVQTGSSLPLGLSLDSITGQVYGNVLAADVPLSILEYVDASLAVQGTISVQWDICPSSFHLTDALTDAQVQNTYRATLGSNSAAALTTVSLYRGALPAGLSATIDPTGANVVVSGVPTEAGYFDVWFRVTNSNGQIGFFQKRFVVEYIAPLVILTQSFENLVSGQPFQQTLLAFGGIAPYTWSIAPNTLPSGLTLNTSSGVLSGSTSVTSFDKQITVTVTDARGVAASAVLELVIVSKLTIGTAVLPLVIPSQTYQYQLLGYGGVAPYTWTLANGSPSLPGGITLSPSGLISGATTLVNYTQQLVFQLTDSASNAVTKALSLVIGAPSGLYIDTEGVGAVVRGQAYQGYLAVQGPGVAPYVWSVAPDTTNPLPEGLFLTTDAADNGATATLGGSATAPLLNLPVKIQVVDANGQLATAFLLLSSYSGLTITTTRLPQATVSGSYSVQLSATGANPGFTWSLDPISGSLPNGFTLTAAGLISGTPTLALSATITVRVTDMIGDYQTRVYTLTATQSTLAITTTALPSATAGLAYAQSLAATGGQAPYSWSISPNSSAQLPSGLFLDPASGAITGTSKVSGVSSIVFRVCDAIGVIREATVAFSVVIGLTLVAGTDWNLGTNLGFLGMIRSGNADTGSINPRPLGSYLVVAENVVSTQVGQIAVGLPIGFQAAVSLKGNVAYISLSGPFGSGAIGDNAFPVNVSDSGISVSQNFLWRVYAEDALSIQPVSGALPVLYLN